MHHSQKLVAFLAKELQARGIEAVAPQNMGDFDWSLARDDFGFKVDVDVSAHDELFGTLQSAFGDPKFDSPDTLIFRADGRQTTVMLNRDGQSAALILLDWRDREIRSQMESRVVDAVAEVLEDVAQQVQDLITDVEKANSEEDRDTAVEELRQKVEELEDLVETRGSGSSD